MSISSDENRPQAPNRPQALNLLSLTEASELLSARKITSKELAHACIEQTKSENARLNAFITVDEPGALSSASDSDKRYSSGSPLGPLDGIPFAVKDNICTKDMRTTCGSAMLSDFLPPYDADAVNFLRRDGAFVIGKTNMDEFAMGSSSTTSYTGRVENPRASGRTAGGSSGGSAAAVAAFCVPFALGSDTGGSVRLPAAYCGVTGFVPTYGCISRFGLISYASSLDRIGVIARSVRDCALAFDSVNSTSPRDSTCVSAHRLPCFPYTENIPCKIRVGFDERLLSEVKEKAAAAPVKKAIKAFSDAGAEIIPVSVGDPYDALAAYRTTAYAEASSNLARFDGIRFGHRASSGDCRDSRTEGFGEEVKRRILAGTHILKNTGLYNSAANVRNTVCDCYSKAFKLCDIILGPVSRGAAPQFDAPEDPYTDLFTVQPSLAGLPSITVPFGNDSQRLPVSVQLTGPRFSERLLLCAGRLLELSREAFEACTI